jgi:hypothetical protein
MRAVVAGRSRRAPVSRRRSGLRQGVVAGATASVNQSIMPADRVRCLLNPSPIGIGRPPIPRADSLCRSVDCFASRAMTRARRSLQLVVAAWRLPWQPGGNRDRKLATGGQDNGACRAAIAGLLTVALVACASVPTTTPESQSKQRLYFIWPRGWTMKTGTLDIKVNDEVAGKIAPDSYFFVDRKPGTYTLRVEPPFDFSYFEADVQVAAGGTYYYSINSRGAAVALVGGGVVTMNPTPTTGAPIEAKNGTLATYKLRAMDAAAAVAAMKDLDTK